MHLVKKTNPKLRDYRLVAIDFENDPITGIFLCAHVFSWDDPPLDLGFDSLPLLEQWLMSQHSVGSHKPLPFILVGYNWGYDFPFLSNITDGSKTCWCGSRFITGRLKNGIKLYDLCNHVDGSLENWISYLEMEKKWSIKKESLDDLSQRCASDAKQTYYLARFIVNFYLKELGVPFKYTVGSVSLALFTSKYMEHYWYRRDDQQWISDYERQALRGGRVEAFERGEIDHFSYDVNSIYLSVLQTCSFPYPGSANYVSGNADFDYHFEQHLCIAHCVVRAPVARIMVLPYYDPVKKKLIFPYGVFEGYWASPELKLALEQGYEILTVLNYIWYAKEHPYFSDFASFVWSHRRKYQEEGNPGMSRLLKKVGNTLFGKFGQQNDSGGYWGKLSDYDGDLLDKRIEVATIEGVEYVSISSNDRKD